MIFEKNSKLIFIGDSITDCRRKQPVGEGGAEALGFGYASFAAALINCTYPENNYRIVNMGVDGNRVIELKERWKRDVLDLQPDYLSIMIGVNDIWRQFHHPQMKELHVYIDEYKRTLEELIEKALPGLKGLILMTPFFIEKNENDPMRIEVIKYGKVVKELSEKYGAVFVNTQEGIDKLIEVNYSAHYALDRVHPTETGHMAVAKAFLKAIGYSFS